MAAGFGVFAIIFGVTVFPAAWGLRVLLGHGEPTPIWGAVIWFVATMFCVLQCIVHQHKFYLFSVFWLFVFPAAWELGKT